MHLANILKLARETKGLSKQEAADKTNINRSYFYDLENPNQEKAGVKKISQILKDLKVGGDVYIKVGENLILIDNVK